MRAAPDNCATRSSHLTSQTTGEELEGRRGNWKSDKDQENRNSGRSPDFLAQSSNRPPFDSGAR